MGYHNKISHPAVALQYKNVTPKQKNILIEKPPFGYIPAPTRENMCAHRSQQAS